jgi:DNA-binding NtrC family response regulator
MFRGVEFRYNRFFMTLNEINVLVGQSDWAWRAVVANIFAPRGINAMVAAGAGEAMDIMESTQVHMAIVDVDCRTMGGLSIVRVIRGCEPMLPCIMVTGESERSVLAKALELDVFSVVAKPVDMGILQQQLDRLFVKRYNSMVFSE